MWIKHRRLLTKRFACFRLYSVGLYLGHIHCVRYTAIFRWVAATIPRDVLFMYQWIYWSGDRHAVDSIRDHDSFSETSIESCVYFSSNILSIWNSDWSLMNPIWIQLIVAEGFSSLFVFTWFSPVICCGPKLPSPLRAPNQIFRFFCVPYAVPSPPSRVTNNEDLPCIIKGMKNRKGRK